MRKKTLVIMAAGMGSRYGGMKQVDPVGPSGEAVMDYSVWDAVRAGFDKVIFIIKEEHYEVFHRNFGEKLSRFIEVGYAFQSLQNVPEWFTPPTDRTKPWGTGHAVMSCAGQINEPFAVINADDFYGREAFVKLASWADTVDCNQKPCEFCMVGYVLSNTLTENGTVARGVCRVDKDGILENVTERTKIAGRGDKVQYTEDGETWVDIDGASTVSMNCWCFPPVFLAELKPRFEEFLRANSANLQKAEFFLPFAVQDMIDEGKCRVRVLETDEKWYGMTYKDDRDAVRQAIAAKVASGEYPEKLW